LHFGRSLPRTSDSHSGRFGGNSSDEWNSREIHLIGVGRTGSVMMDPAPLLTASGRISDLLGTGRDFLAQPHGPHIAKDVVKDIAWHSAAAV